MILQAAIITVLAAIVFWFTGKALATGGRNSIDDLAEDPGPNEWPNKLNVPIPNRVPAAVLRHKRTARLYAKKYDIPVNILLAMMWQENSGYMNPDGAAGEKGIMQLKEIAIRDLQENGYKVPANWRDDPEDNIHAGAQFLHLQRRRAGNIYTALAGTRSTALEAYNEGFAGSLRDTAPDEYAEEVIAKSKALKDV